MPFPFDYMYDAGEIHDAIYNMAPEAAGTLSAKYEAVMDGVDYALMSGDPLLERDANYALEKLDQISDNLVNNVVYDPTKLLEDFDAELNIISEDLCLTGPDIEVSVVLIPTIEFVFTKIDGFLASLGIPSINKAEYISKYKKLPENFKVSLYTLEIALESLKNVVGQSDYLKSILSENRYELFKAIGLYMNGMVDAANKTVADLESYLAGFGEVDELRQNIGIDILTNQEVNILWGVLKKNKISKENALKHIKTIKELPEYKNIQFDAEELNTYLFHSILFLEKDKELGEDFVELMTHMNSVFSINKAIYTDQIRNAAARAIKKSEELKFVQEDKETFVGESKINITFDYEHRMDIDVLANMKATRNLHLNTVKYELASEYLGQIKSKKGAEKAKGIIDEIFKVTDIYEVDVILEKYNLSKNLSSLRIVKAYDAKVKLAELSLDISSYTRKHPAVEESYTNFYKTGKIDEEQRALLTERFEYELNRLTDLDAFLFVEMEQEKEYLDYHLASINNINQVAFEDQPEVRSRLQAYMLMLAQYRLVQGKMIGVASSYAAINSKHHLDSPFTKEYRSKILAPSIIFDDSGNISLKLMNPVAGHYSVDAWADKYPKSNDYLAIANLREIAGFLKINESVEIPAIAALSRSNLHGPLLLGEIRPFMKRSDDLYANVQPSAEAWVGMGKAFKDYNKDPENYGVDVKQLLTNAMIRNEQFSHSIKTARGSLKSLKADIQSQLNDKTLERKYPHLAETRTELYKHAMANIDKLLNSGDSPFSQKTLDGLSESYSNLHKEHSKDTSTPWYAYLIIVPFAVIAGLLTIKAGGIGAVYVWGVGTTVSTVSTLALMGAGATVGMRLGMHTTNAMGITEIQVSWHPWDLAQDWAFNTAASGAFMVVGRAAGGFLKGLELGKYKWLAGSAIFARIGAVGTRTMAYGRTALSPGTWGRGAGYAPSTIAGRTVLETGQEYIETAAELSGNPVLGMLAATINSSDGMNVEMSRAGINAQKVGLVVENGNHAYTTATAQEFVNNLTQEFEAKTWKNLEYKIHSDESVTIKITDNLHAIFGELEYTVQPSQKFVTPDVEVARIRGIEHNSQTGNYEINSTSDLGLSLTLLASKGFLLSKTENGIKATKGDVSYEIVVDAKVEQSFERTLQRYVNARKEVETLLEAKATKNTIAVQLATMSLLAFTLTGCGENTYNPLEAGGDLYFGLLTQLDALFMAATGIYFLSVNALLLSSEISKRFPNIFSRGKLGITLEESLAALEQAEQAAAIEQSTRQTVYEQELAAWTEAGNTRDGKSNRGPKPQAPKAPLNINSTYEGLTLSQEMHMILSQGTSDAKLNLLKSIKAVHGVDNSKIKETIQHIGESSRKLAAMVDPNNLRPYNEQAFLQERAKLHTLLNTLSSKATALEVKTKGAWLAHNATPLMMVGAAWIVYLLASRGIGGGLVTKLTGADPNKAETAAEPPKSYGPAPSGPGPTAPPTAPAPTAPPTAPAPTAPPTAPAPTAPPTTAPPTTAPPTTAPPTTAPPTAPSTPTKKQKEQKILDEGGSLPAWD